jgi:uncharacterized membrane protein (DUF4010 family)
MSSEILKLIPADLINFLLVVLFSLLIGLEQRRHHIKEEFERLFGTDRTITLIGILGYILYIISPQNLMLFLGGLVALTILLGIFYFQKIKFQQKFGLTSVITSIVVYCLAPLLYTQPHWFVFLVVVCLLILTEIKENLFEFSQKFDDKEFITLAKFLVLACVFLPLLPDAPISPAINISPYRFWLAIVVVSGISYASYLLKKFVFPKSGIILTGILGGLYSSTATTVILAKKSREGSGGKKIIPAIFSATTMMYLRIFLLSLFFNRNIALVLIIPFVILMIISALLTYYFIRISRGRDEIPEVVVPSHRNPLEFKTAIVFAGLFIIFALITGFVMKTYGGSGISRLSWVVGVTDIDPFIINLLQGKWNIENQIIAVSIINATTSNNILKMVYALMFSGKSIHKFIIVGFSILIAAGILIALL